MSHFGKFRGQVVNNIDPMQMGRVQVQVPAVLGDGQLSWAMPCAPFSGKDAGFFAVPPVDASVWVEFEGAMIDVGPRTWKKVSREPVIAGATRRSTLAAERQEREHESSVSSHRGCRAQGHRKGAGHRLSEGGMGTNEASTGRRGDG